MNELSIANISNIYEQNYRHYMKIKNSKKIKKQERENIKYKLYFNAQSQLNLSVPQCILNRIDKKIHANVFKKFDELKKAETGISNGGGNLIENVTDAIDTGEVQQTPIPTESIPQTNQSAASKPQEINEQFECTKSVAIRDKNNKEEIITFKITTSIPLNNESPVGSDNLTPLTESSISEETEDYMQIVNTVFDKNTAADSDSIQSQNINEQVAEIPSKSIKNEIYPENEKLRPRKPVLYTENLSHIHFSAPHNKKRSSVSKKDSFSSKKRKRSGHVTSTVTSSSSLSSSLFQSNLDTISGTVLINNTDALQCDQIVEIKQLPTNAKRSMVEINMPRSLTNSMNMKPCLISVNLQKIDVSNLLDHSNFRVSDRALTDTDIETLRAVATITNEIPPPTAPPKRKRIRKPRPVETSTPKSLTKTTNKSDLAKYIEGFGESSTANAGEQNSYVDNILTNNNQYIQVSNQSPQNAGISTTTAELNSIGDAGGLTVLTKNANGAWTIQPITNSNVYGGHQQVIDAELLNTNQLEAEFASENGIFNIINYIEGDNIAMAANSAQDINNSRHDNRNQTFINSSSPKYISSSCEMANLFVQQPAQPTVMNYYERSIAYKNLVTTPVPSGMEQQNTNDGGVLVNAHASTRSRLLKVSPVSDNKLNVLDLSVKLPEVDGKLVPECSYEVPPRFPKTRILSFEDYKMRQIDNTIENLAGVKGPDMPNLFVEKDDTRNVDIINDNSAIKYQSPKKQETSDNNIKAGIVLKNENSPTLIATNMIIKTPDRKTKFEMDTKILVKISKDDKRIVESYQINHPDPINGNALDSTIENKNALESKMKKDEIDNDNNADESVSNAVQNNCIQSPVLDGKKCIDDFLSMKDNTELDYEDDCLRLYSSPCNDFDEQDSDTEQLNKTLPPELNSPPHEIASNTNENLTNTSEETPANNNNNNEIYCTDIFGLRQRCIITNNTTPTNFPPNILDIKPLKTDFKIPKLAVAKNKSKSPDPVITTIPNGIQPNNMTVPLHELDNIEQSPPKLRCWPNNPTNILKPYATTEDILKHNARFSIPSASSNNLTIMHNNKNNQNSVADSKKKNLRIFDSPCLNFLQDKCFENKCRFKHTFASSNEMKLRLLILDGKDLLNAYKFVMRFYKLFRNYFEIFCEIFAETNNRQMLTNDLIMDCQQYTNSSHFLRHIVKGLMKTGYSNVESIQMIINKLDNSSGSINIIVELIIEANPMAFLKPLNFYSNMNQYSFQIRSIRKLAGICLNNKSLELIYIVEKILQRIPRSKWEGDSIIIEFYELCNKINTTNQCLNEMTNSVSSAPIRTIVQHDNLNMIASAQQSKNDLICELNQLQQQKQIQQQMQEQQQQMQQDQQMQQEQQLQQQQLQQQQQQQQLLDFLQAAIQNQYQNVNLNNFKS